MYTTMVSKNKIHLPLSHGVGSLILRFIFCNCFIRTLLQKPIRESWINHERRQIVCGKVSSFIIHANGSPVWLGIEVIIQVSDHAISGLSSWLCLVVCFGGSWALDSARRTAEWHGDVVAGDCRAENVTPRSASAPPTAVLPTSRRSGKVGNSEASGAKVLWMPWWGADVLAHLSMPNIMIDHAPPTCFETNVFLLRNVLIFCVWWGLMILFVLNYLHNVYFSNNRYYLR